MAMVILPFNRDAEIGSVDFAVYRFFITGERYNRFAFLLGFGVGTAVFFSMAE